MRQRVERVKCPCCKGHPALQQICTACHGKGMAVLLHKPGGHEVEVHDLENEDWLRQQYPDEPTPVHERTNLHEAWQSFMKMVEIVRADPKRKREMKRAFFAGAYWMLDMCSIQMDPGKEATEADLEYFQRLHYEIMAYVKDVEEGRA